uniref:NADH-ubiquinone oxidoreductase chain 5 n=1 Tax=Monocellicampa pruni TaxID=1322158 RepID=K4LM86_9HYME|nr:NADH dehydrogenase subunit 5 [Monocellicampa pruni]
MIFLDICLMMMLILLCFSFLMMYLGVYFLINSLKIFIEINIFSLNSSCIVMTVFLDWMSLFFLSIVLFISSSVIYYSKYYMLEDLSINRFIMLVMMFILSMMMLIISPNLISILLGWDGLGLVSYCLVIYYQNVKSFNAGMLTVLSNRVGDVFLLMSIAWMMNFGSWNYIFYLEFMQVNKEMMVIFMFILLAAFTKSAQIPFSSWLPAAMAAPTPVSSLVHSSTLVTAGVYLLIRFENLFNDEFIFWFLMFSLITMFMAGLNANFEYDLKKIIALSTLSQLGLMMKILFLGASEMAFFHLLTHALFKALLFMCAGAMIHNLLNFQDIRYMGSISMQMPLVSICFNFSNLALCGFPFLAGFYSKDMVLEKFFLMDFNLFVFLMFFISTLFTIMYTCRLIYFSMMMNYSMISLNFLSDKFWNLNKSLMGLLVLVIFGGCYLSWMIFPYPYMICLPYYLKILPVMIIFIGAMLSYFMNFSVLMKLSFSNFYFMKMFSSGMWFLPIISTYGLIKQPMILSMNLTYYMDQNWSESLMGRGLIKTLMKMFFFFSFINLLF